MKTLVTGGAGFIGSNLVDGLLQAGHQVVVVDDLSTGSRENVSKQAAFCQETILNKDGLQAIFSREKPDFVCHYAAQIDVRKSVSDPQHDAAVNIIGGLNVLQCSLKVGVRKLVYVSTGGAVYGDPAYIPVDENHPVRPLCPYGVSKHALEHYLHLHAVNDGLRYTVLRYPNVYGPRQNPKGEAGVIAIFTDKMMQGQRPTIFGDGTQTRDYTFVGDVVAANLLALEKGESEIFNIGTGVESTVLDIVETLNDLLGTHIEPILAPARVGEVYRIALSAERAKSVLGWHPKHDLKAGLKKTVDYYKSVSQ
ncbi:MAG TPA: NAD-dependent epimerase/dehydratase family protein [bacterium]|nr:NAD-dependent epimerase/dehydratase family protein [bacterium]